jgi:hypothetical protein
MRRIYFKPACSQCGESTFNGCPGLRLCSTCYHRDWRKRHPHIVAAVCCAVCGTSFQPPRNDARYCSAACRQKAYRQRLSKPVRSTVSAS